MDQREQYLTIKALKARGAEKKLAAAAAGTGFFPGQREKQAGFARARGRSLT